MATEELHAAVREKVESAEIRRDPFPHVIVPDLLPEPFFRQLAGTVPPLELFDVSPFGKKADLPLGEHKKVFKAAPEEFQAAWRVWRDEVLRETIRPVLVRRLEAEIREKYAELLSPEIADRIMADGLTSADGRLMSRKPGYVLEAHTDSGHFAITCLLYFTEGSDRSSGALCLFRPERRPELKHLGTYYPDREEGISHELVAEVPIRENLFVAFLNGPAALHGVRIDPVEGDTEPAARLTFQAHILAAVDFRKDAEHFVDDLPDEAARRRWHAYLDRKRETAAG